ncbi:hypothetical protein PIB30_046636 [Stylosanthes scabra]|uniref:Uncharacterized protein n=1 Tax=Stylosanthes scabra TaxID=79078 RepID=A0ABU6WIH8_9FABA|nr:hypothetical protein [Stylosanthes scabra]
MGCQVSIFKVRRCAFGNKLYGVAESYSREGVDVEVNSPRSPEIGLWDSMSNIVSRVRECVYLEWVMPPVYIVAALFLKNWTSRLVRNIAPTREHEAFGPSLRVMNFLGIFRVVLTISDYLVYCD